MYKLGLTGGIATGKSTVVDYLKSKYQLPVLDADKIAHAILEPGQPALSDLVQTFGPDMLFPDGSLNRSKLGTYVFNNPVARQRLNEITHPRVFDRMNTDLQGLKKQQVPLVVLDIPLLFESQQAMNYDAICVVATDATTQLERLMKRNQMSETDAKARIAAQLPLANKMAQADFIIDNNGNLENTYKQIDQMLTKIQAT